MELLSYPVLNAVDEAAIRDFLSDVTIVDLNREIKASAVALRRAHRLKLPDAIIAATAQYVRAVLLTNDLKLLSLPMLAVRAVPLIEEASPPQ
jgi:predicted nucleic acid-binding protein